MPAHKGVEPFTRIWVIQAEVNQIGVVNGKRQVTAIFLKVNIFTTLQGYLDWKQWLPTQTINQAYFYNIRQDYGEQKWFNDKLWMQTQLLDMFGSGNFVPNLLP